MPRRRAGRSPKAAPLGRRRAVWSEPRRRRSGRRRRACSVAPVPVPVAASPPSAGLARASAAATPNGPVRPPSPSAAGFPEGLDHVAVRVAALDADIVALGPSSTSSTPPAARRLRGRGRRRRWAPRCRNASTPRGGRAPGRDQARARSRARCRASRRRRRSPARGRCSPAGTSVVQADVVAHNRSDAVDGYSNLVSGGSTSGAALLPGMETPAPVGCDATRATVKPTCVRLICATRFLEPGRNGGRHV
jgi:hypothetical protein